MIVGVAVCPGAPFLVPGVAEPLAAGSAELVAACAAAVRSLAGADRIILLTAGRRTVLYPPGTVAVSASPLRRSDLAPRRCGPALAAGTIVGRALLDRAFPDVVPAPVAIVETGEDPATTCAAIRHGHPGSDALLVIADGVGDCHGDARTRPAGRPGRAVRRHAGRALAAGDPAALRRASADRDLAPGAAGRRRPVGACWPS